jgi:hypothetical protein
MAWTPNRLLVEMYEAVQKELAAALERSPRREIPSDGPEPSLVEHFRKIDALRSAMAALEGALERPESRIIH